MTQSETETVFGSTIPVTYLDVHGVSHSTTATALPSTYQIGIANQYTDNTGYMISGRDFLCYQFQADTLNAEPRQITIDISCQYSIFDTEFIYTAAAMPCATQTNISAYNSPSWSWIFAGNNLVFSPSDIANNNVLPQVYFSDWCDFVMAYMDSQASTSGYSLRITFDHASFSNGNYVRFYIGLPYISQGASGNNGTSGLTTTGSETTTTEININVDVDLSTTNTLLGGVIAAIQNVASAILNGLANLFIPTQEQLEDWKDDMQQLLADHLGGLYEAVDYITDFLQNLTTAEAATYIHINQMTIPIKYIRVGSSPLTLDTYNFVLGPYDVNLKYDDLHLIYDGLALIVDFLATWYFLNMCRNKLEIILNPDSEKIEE